MTFRQQELKHFKPGRQAKRNLSLGVMIVLGCSFVRAIKHPRFLCGSWLATALAAPSLRISFQKIIQKTT